MPLTPRVRKKFVCCLHCFVQQSNSEICHVKVLLWLQTLHTRALLPDEATTCHPFNHLQWGENTGDKYRGLCRQYSIRATGAHFDFSHFLFSQFLIWKMIMFTIVPFCLIIDSQWVVIAHSCTNWLINANLSLNIKVGGQQLRGVRNKY